MALEFGTRIMGWSFLYYLQNTVKGHFESTALSGISLPVGMIEAVQWRMCKY